MPNCNFNGCYGGPYYPRRINTSSCLNTCSVGRIVNPSVQVEWGVFLLDGDTTVGAGNDIPVQISNSSGTAITDLGGGVIRLSAGLYEISYSLNALIPSSGEVRVSLGQNSVIIPGTESVATGDEGETVNLSNKIIVNLESSSNLSAVNLSSDAVNFQGVNLTILKL